VRARGSAAAAGVCSLRGQQVDLRRMWACAVLKVMHGIFYIDNNLKLRHFHAIRSQVFGRSMKSSAAMASTTS
jgi:uncharacterized protein (TIGR04552 family)